MVAYRFHQYQVVGRALPTPGDEQPKIYRMKLWATNEVRAKSKFWYFLRKLKKVKKANGQMLAINENQMLAMVLILRSIPGLSSCQRLISSLLFLREQNQGSSSVILRRTI